jgi:hypothetical protein
MNPDVVTLLIGVLVTLFGLLSCFYGWRIFKLVLVVGGLLIGAAIGVQLSVDPATGASNGLIVVLMALVGAAVIVALLRVAVFVAGALFGAVVGLAIVNTFGIDPAVAVLIYAAFGVVGGLLALWIQKLMIILATAFGGAMAILFGFGLMFPSLSLLRVTVESVRLSSAGQPPLIQPGDTTQLVGTILWLVLGVLGFAGQMRTSREWRSRKDL